ncbi:MAG TPA: endonuclease Q family protein [Candidatus Saccharimonadales bacterium]|nr:endonuclease Q family protein [Candidatus Saccharimonadales bacterium]
MTKIVSDLHLHSSYARATSKELNFDTLSLWAKIKGINLLSSADFTHPIWAKESLEKLKEEGNGLFSYKELSFMLGAEVSCIFSQGGKLRRVHLLLYVPSFDAMQKVNTELGKRGKLGSDGRPILGLTAKAVLEILLSADENAIMIPAHAWTPWFGVLGQNGGFDSLEECFGDLTKYIYAVETGLSSDPQMNWRVKELDERSIVSFSDAHSAPKMGRELTIFDTELSYPGILEALKKQKIEQTIEFFPEEGKYHYNGHRNCNFKETPSGTVKRNLLCPNCKKPLTIGVMHRVETLAEKDRPEGFTNKSRPGFSKFVPLLEIVAETKGSPVASRKVKESYHELIEKHGSEVDILTKLKTEELEEPRLAEAIEKVRREDIYIDPGYDGVYGEVHIWKDKGKKSKEPKQIEKVEEETPQIRLFD